MKKIFMLSMLLSFGSPLFSQFDFYATAVLLKVNDNTVFYNNTAPGSGQNIGTDPFQSAELGTFAKNSGNLRVLGAEVKTFKSSGNNVCGATLFFTVYPQGARPASPVYSSVGIGFYADCNEGACTDKWGFFEALKGGGCCNAGDQKWQYPAGGNGGGNNGDIDVTTYEPGKYTLEMYYQIKGDDNGNTGCNDSRFDNNSSAPANYTASFSISEPLPVKFGNVSATSTKSGNQIKWSTLSEQNVKLFQVERSPDGLFFTQAGNVGSKGNSNRLTNYSYLDPVPANGTIYYRITMIEHTGLKQYSPVVKASSTNAGILISPNPATDYITISGAVPGCGVRVINAAGATVRRLVLTAETQRLNIQTLRAGNYTLQVVNGSKVLNKPLLIVK